MTAPTARPDRPAAVSLAAFLLSGSAALWVSAAVATLFAIPEYAWHAGNAARDPAAGAVPTVLLVLFDCVAVCAAATAVLLAVFDAGGRTTARILTWVYAGITALVAALLLLTDPFAGVGWHHWLSTGVAALTLACTAAVTVLLALPPTNRYVRAVRAVRLAARRRWHPAPATPRHPYPPVTPPYRPYPSAAPYPSAPPYPPNGACPPDSAHPLAPTHPPFPWGLPPRMVPTPTTAPAGPGPMPPHGPMAPPGPRSPGQTPAPPVLPRSPDPSSDQ